jgi:hypothetical protein
MNNLLELNEFELMEIGGGTVHPAVLIYDAIRLGWSFGEWLANLEK